MRQPFSADLGLLLLRLAAGIFLLMSGLRKASWIGTEGSEAHVDALGVPLAEYIGPALPYVEIVGGAMLCLGLLTRLAAAVLALLAGAGAVLMVLGVGTLISIQESRDQMLLLIGNPLEFSVLLAVLGIVLMLTGAGGISADAPLRRALRR